MNIMLLTVRPNTPGSINGSTLLCPNTQAAYSISSITNATIYVWTSSGGSSIVSGQGTTSVVVKAPSGFSSGSLTVKASNCKGTSGSRTMNLTGIASQPGSITGSNSVCKSQTKPYYITLVSGATSYNWSITGGATISSGQGTTSVNVNFNTSVSSTSIISVSALNGCGSSPIKTKSISVNLSCKIGDSQSGQALEDISELSVYPNPTAGKLVISFNSKTKSKVILTVVDLLGNIVHLERIDALEDANNVTIDLTGLSNGMYILSLQNEALEVRKLKIVFEN